jgi:hypothetical protein
MMRLSSTTVPEGALSPDHAPTHRAKDEQMKIGAALVVVWLVIGVLAAGQRGYYHGSSESCAKASTIAVTIIAGPLNYIGVNPKIHCKVPQPSK